MPKGLIAFDLETSNILPDGSNWHDHRPLGISCAAAVTDTSSKLWHGGEWSDGRYGSMTATQVNKIVGWLWEQRHTHNIVTWNGLAFDFCVLADNVSTAKLRRACAILALRHHIDMAFAMLCSKGYMIGLEAAAKGLKVAGKMEGMSGAVAPVFWAQSREQQEIVLQYVQQDVRATLDIYQGIVAQGCLTWTSRSGRSQVWPTEFVEGRIRTVEEALKVVEPDTSWMDKPRLRASHYAWSDWITTQIHGEPDAEVPVEETVQTKAPIATVQLHLDTDFAARFVTYMYACMIEGAHPPEARRLFEAVKYYARGDDEKLLTSGGS